MFAVAGKPWEASQCPFTVPLSRADVAQLLHVVHCIHYFFHRCIHRGLSMTARCLLPHYYTCDPVGCMQSLKRRTANLD